MTLSLAVLAAALAVLSLGWLGQVAPFVRPAPDLPAMMPLTAICVAALAAALLLRHAHPAGMARIAIVVGGVAVLNLGLILSGVPLGLEAYLPLERLPTDRMAPTTSFAIILLSASVLTLNADRSVGAMALSVFGMSATFCLAVLTLDDMGGPSLFAPLSGMSIYTEFCVLALFGVVAAEA